MNAYRRHTDVDLAHALEMRARRDVDEDTREMLEEASRRLRTTLPEDA